MIIVDLETTDLPNDITQDPAEQPGIVQIGLVEVNSNWEMEEKHKWLVNPEIPAFKWDEKAIKTHGITPDRVSNEPPLSSLLPSLASIFRRHLTWVGYNNQFDRKVLFYQVARYGWQWKFPWPSVDIDIMSVGADVANMAGKQGNKPPKLLELHTHLFGQGFDSAHDALADSLAAFRCGHRLHEMGLL